MSCKRSFTTNTGTFTIYDEWVTKCEAKFKCLEKGQILAPITNRRDSNKMMKLFRSNHGIENCTAVLYGGASYHIGLDITYTESEQKKIFTNGVEWDDKKHLKIYTDYNKEFTNCAIALFQPAIQHKPFPMMSESLSCTRSYRRSNFYICLKPKSNTTDASVVQLKESNQTAESIVQLKESAVNGAYLPSGFVIAVLMFVIGVFAGVSMQNRKHSKEKEELRKMLSGLKTVQKVKSNK